MSTAPYTLIDVTWLKYYFLLTLFIMNHIVVPNNTRIKYEDLGK